MTMKRMTKVVCTIGPASSSPETIRQLIESGMNVARLNFSHGTHESHREIIHKVRSIAKDMGTYVGILQDLCGPKIRLGILPEEGVPLHSGQEISLKSGSTYTEGVLPLAYANIHNEVHQGESILLADGMMELEVLRVDGDKVVCKVITGGRIFSRKGVNMPRSALSVSAFSEKDRDDLLMGLGEKVDFVAMSFVRDADDLTEIKSIINKSEHKPQLIAKIEKPQAVDNLAGILSQVEGVMVARGDLGVEVPLEKVPIIQKNIIRASKDAGKTVITATQMLMSMVSNPRPTRGEASDVANAILDGTDAVMLSDESANGQYPVQACATLGKIAAATEPYVVNVLSREASSGSVSLAVGRAACWLASDIKAAAIVAYTRSGFTVNAVSHFRPCCPILALTPEENTCRQLSLSWGTFPLLVDGYADTDAMFEAAKELVLANNYAKKGDLIVLTAGVPMGKVGSTTLLRVMTV